MSKRRRCYVLYASFVDVTLKLHEQRTGIMRLYVKKIAYNKLRLSVDTKELYALYDLLGYLGYTAVVNEEDAAVDVIITTAYNSDNYTGCEGQAEYLLAQLEEYDYDVVRNL